MDNYMVKMDFKASTNANKMRTRGAMSGRAVETWRTCKAKSTFVGDATILCNKAPVSNSRAETLLGTKKEIKKYCKTLPVKK